MRQEEYDERKRVLDRQLRDGIALLEAAHRQQVRALDLVWMTTGPEGATVQPSPAPAVQPAQPQSQPAAPPERNRRQAGELYEEVLRALAGVPRVFSRGDVCAALGYEPQRASLYRIFKELVRDGVLTLDERGGGRVSATYRKTAG